MRLPQLRSIPAAQVRRSPSRRPGDRAHPALITQPELPSVLHPGPTGPQLSAPEGQGQRWRPGLPAGPQAGSPRTPSGSRRVRRGGGAQEEGGRRAGSREWRGRAAWDASSPRFPLAPSPLPCLWAFRHRRRHQRAPGRRSESRLEGVSCVPRWRSSLQVGMRKGRDWGSGSRLAPSLWRLYSSRPSHSASAPPPGPAGPFPHSGDESPAARGIVGVVVPECGRGRTCSSRVYPRLRSVRRRCVATRGARSFFLIGRGVYQRLLLSALPAAVAERGEWAS